MHILGMFFVGERKSRTAQTKRKTPAGNLSRKFNLHNVLILVFITENKSNISPAIVMCQLVSLSACLSLISLPEFSLSLFLIKTTT